MIEPVKQLELFPTANDMQVGGDHYMDRVIQPWDYIVSAMTLVFLKATLSSTSHVGSIRTGLMTCVRHSIT